MAQMVKCLHMRPQDQFLAPHKTWRTSSTPENRDKSSKNSLNQKFKVSLGYIESLRLAWAT